MPKILIELLDEAYDWIKTGFPDEADEEFATNAIKNGTILSECEDCISRDDVKILLRKEFPNMTNRTYNALWDEVDTLPSVYPKSDNYISELTQKMYEAGKKDGYVEAKMESDNQVLEDIKAEIAQMFDSMGRDFKVFYKDELFALINSHINRKEQTGENK